MKTEFIRTNRYYWRCGDCLEIFAVEGWNNKMLCDCGGTCEMMGQVQGVRIVDLKHVCPCDGRCTGARGPSCDCPCGGENHGTGKLVEVIRDLGPIPKARSKSNPIVAAEYRAAVEKARTKISIASATRNPYYEQRKLRKAICSNVHKNRMKILAELIGA